MLDHSLSLVSDSRFLVLLISSCRSCFTLCLCVSLCDSSHAPFAHRNPLAFQSEMVVPHLRVPSPSVARGTASSHILTSNSPRNGHQAALSSSQVPYSSSSGTMLHTRGGPTSRESMGPPQPMIVNVALYPQHLLLLSFTAHYLLLHHQTAGHAKPARKAPSPPPPMQ